VPCRLLCDKDESVEFLSLPDITNASGPDSVAAHMQKATACSIAPLMMKLLTLNHICIRNGTLPSMWNMHPCGTIPWIKYKQLQTYVIVVSPKWCVGKSYDQLDQKTSAYYIIVLNNFVFHWICPYLSDQRQEAVLNGCSSIKCDVICPVYHRVQWLAPALHKWLEFPGQNSCFMNITS